MGRFSPVLIETVKASTSAVPGAQRVRNSDNQQPAPSGLMRYPEPTAEELAGVATLTRLLAVLEGGIVIQHPYLDLRVSIDRIVGPRLSYLIMTGQYELGDLLLIDRHLKRGDRVLELGGGVGLTAALSAKRSGRRVIVVEPDDRVHPLIAYQAALNGGDVSLISACAVAEASAGKVPFFVSEQIWFSSMTADNRGVPSREISVETRAFNDLLEEHQPTVVMIDVEGAERCLFDRPLLHRPRKILVEIHTPDLGEALTCRTIQQVINQGYALVDLSGWTFVFEAL